jgi:integrase/recombinase XerC
MTPLPEIGQNTSKRKSGARTQKQAATWLTPEQIEDIRDACLTDVFPNYLQGRNETIIALLADTGLRVSELVALDWEYLDAEPGELYLPSR